MRRRRRTATLATLAAVAVAAGCGSDDFENVPRPPATIELAARVDDRKVQVSPREASDEPIGAGLANITVSNQTAEPVRLSFVGPNDLRTGPVVGNGTLQFKLDLEEGLYIVEADDPSIRGTELAVGPERPSAQNDLLLP